MRNLVQRLWSRLPKRLRQAASPVVRLLAQDHVPHASIPRVYPTLQCNLKCPFCSDGLDYDKSHMGYQPLPPERWIEIIDALPGPAVIFTGGEPTLYQPLPDVINAIRQPTVMLYTNLSYNVAKFFDRLERPVTVFASFHPNNKGVTAERILANVKVLKAHPRVRDVVNLHSINHPSNGDLEEARRFFEQNGIHLDIHQDQFLNNSNSPAACDGRSLQTVHCAYDRIIIGPDGQRWICVSKMIRNIRDGLVPMGQRTVPEMVCHEFGRCSPCDEVAKITQVGAATPV